MEKTALVTILEINQQDLKRVTQMRQRKVVGTKEVKK